MADFHSTTSALLAFRNAREWAQFYDPKNLAAALSVEAGELLELFLWKDAEAADEARVADELARSLPSTGSRRNVPCASVWHSGDEATPWMA